MIISKLRSKVKPRNIDSFEDLYINQKKIIIKEKHFVSEFFQDSGSDAVKRVRGEGGGEVLMVTDHLQVSWTSEISIREITRTSVQSLRK